MNTILTKEEFYEVLEKSRIEFDLKLEKINTEREKERAEREKERAERKKERAEREKERAEKERAEKERAEKERAEREKEWKKYENRMKKLEGSWTVFVESLVKPGIIELFEKFGIELRKPYSDIEVYKDKQLFYQVDLLAIDTNCIVAIEVKTTLRPADIDEHLNRLNKFQQYPPPEFNTKGKILIGAVAGINVAAGADIYAMRNGLFVMEQKGNLLEMTNPIDFKPQEWKIE